MSQTPPPPDETTGSLVSRTRELVAGLVAFVFNVLRDAPPGPMALPQIRLFLRTVIKPGEALIRRAIYLLAAKLPPLKPLLPKGEGVGVEGAQRRSISIPRPATRLIPAFCLTEPTGQARAGKPGKAPPPRTGAAPDLHALSEKFLKRLAALHAACADPDKFARLLRRHLARKRPATLPLALLPPPGITQSRSPDTKSLYASLAQATNTAWPKLRNTS